MDDAGQAHLAGAGDVFRQIIHEESLPRAYVQFCQTQCDCPCVVCRLIIDVMLEIATIGIYFTDLPKPGGFHYLFINCC